MNPKRIGMARASLVITLACLLAACTDSNPIIGTWEVMPGQRATNLVSCRTIKFTESEAFCNGENPDSVVYYDIQESEIEVFFTDGDTLSLTLNDKNTISYRYLFDQVFFKKK